MTLQSERFNRRSSSIFSIGSFNMSGKNTADNSKPDELSEIIRNQKIKQYKNLIKLEQLQNPGQIATLNALQDADIKELSNYIENYFNNCFKEINSTDAILTAAINNPKDSPPKDDYIIKIDSLQSIDFLKNGIKSGTPLSTYTKPEQKAESITSSLSSLPKIASPKSSIVSLSRFQQVQPPPPPIQHSILNLNYLLVLNLNREFFKIERENLNYHKIQAIKKPTQISVHDYEQISIEIKTKKEPSSRFTKKKSTTSLPKNVRYLNSRALTDRLIRYFNHVLKNNWQVRPKIVTQNSQQKAQPQQQESKTNETTEEERKCFLKNNQIVISFQFNGLKALKECKINISIDLAVKIDENELKTTKENVNKSVLEILNQYSKDSDLVPLDEEKRKRLSNWLVNLFNFNISQLYVYPTYLHLWNLNTKVIKLNVLKFLIWFDTIRYTFTNMSSINDVYTLSPVAFKQNFFQTIQNSSAPILLYTKLLQLFLTNCFTLIKEDPITGANFDSEFYEPDLLLFENEDLLLNLILSEIKTPGLLWTSENLLDRLWVSLTNLRSYLFLTSHLPDPFDSLVNQLPKFYLKCTGFLNLKDATASQIFRNKVLITLNSSFESTMKTVLTKVVTEEVDFERTLSDMGSKRVVTVNSPVIREDLERNTEQFRNEKNASNAATKATSENRAESKLDLQ